MYELFKTDRRGRGCNFPALKVSPRGVGWINKATTDMIPDLAGHCQLFYDRDARKIGIKLGVGAHEAGAKKIQHREGRTVFIAFRGFLQHFEIDIPPQGTGPLPITYNTEERFIEVPLKW